MFVARHAQGRNLCKKQRKKTVIYRTLTSIRENKGLEVRNLETREIWRGKEGSGTGKALEGGRWTKKRTRPPHLHYPGIPLLAPHYPPFPAPSTSHTLTYCSKLDDARPKDPRDAPPPHLPSPFLSSLLYSSILCSLCPSCAGNSSERLVNIP